MDELDAEAEQVGFPFKDHQGEWRCKSPGTGRPLFEEALVYCLEGHFGATVRALGALQPYQQLLDRDGGAKQRRDRQEGPH